MQFNDDEIFIYIISAIIYLCSVLGQVCLL